MTTTERAAAIRKTLKARYGWTGRDVSVVSDLYSMGSSIRIRIKNPAVPLAAVKAVADGHESVRYDEYSHEILSGGNRFVFVDYAHEAVAAFRAKYLEPVTTAVAAASGSSLIPVAGTPFFVGRRDEGHRYSLWSETSHLSEHYGPEGLAEAIGARMVPPPRESFSKGTAWEQNDRSSKEG